MKASPRPVGRPAKRRRPQVQQYMNCRGKVTDEAYGCIKVLLKQQPSITPQQVGEAINVSASTARRWMNSKVKPSEIAKKRKPPKVPSAKRKEMQRRRVQVRKLLTKKDVKTNGSKRHVSFPTGSVRRVARTLDVNEHPCRSKSTIQRDAAALKLFSRSRPKAPLQVGDDKSRRVKFARRLKKLLKDGANIIWSDEKKFDSQDHGNRKQWVMRDERPEPRHRTQSCHTVHVWGMINKNRRMCRIIIHDEIDPAAPKYRRGRPRKDEAARQKQAKKRNVTSLVYIDECLKPVFGKMTAADKRKFIFMQDGARAHTANKTTEYLKQVNVQMLEDWPARSPDLNPIEKVWAMMATKVSDRGPLSKAELEVYVTEEWRNLMREPNIVNNFIDGIAKRCDVVIRNGGDVIV